MSNEKTSPLYPQILDNLSYAVLLFDDSFHLIYINTAGEMLFAVSERQVLGMRARDLFICNGKSIENDLKRAVQTSVSLTERGLVLVLPERSVTVNFSVIPLFKRDKADTVLVELQQVDRHLQISKEEQLIAQQNAARMLVRGLAHEIKNPLGGLRGAAQLLDQELGDEELREYTRIIIEESDRLQALIDRMLEPNRLPQKSLLNVHRVLERVRQLVKVEFPEGVNVKRDYDPSIPQLYADSDQLLQAILNIVRNAAQAVGEAGEITLRTRIHRQITIGNRRRKLAVKIDVIDNGPGIKPELLSQIFYPMVTERPNGTGLGLSIAQSLINRHGGLVECTSSPGNTVFSIYLPLENEDDECHPGLGNR